MAGFSQAQWTRILRLAETQGAAFGLPERRERSVVIGSFNTLKLGDDAEGARRWDFLQTILARFDLIALQEVMDDLRGLRRVQAGLDPDFEMLVSDTTGATPGDPGLRERLAFLYRASRFERDPLVSDITYDRSRVVAKLQESRALWNRFFEDYERKVAAARARGRKPPSLSDVAHPAFLVFIRTPHYAAFTLRGRSGAEGIRFLAINAHTLYGVDRDERRREFLALLEWLFLRSKMRDRVFHPNLVLLGDLNMQFDARENPRAVVEENLRQLNRNQLSAADAARVTFPLLLPHPGRVGLLRTNARRNETFDQIAFFVDPAERRLPRGDTTAGSQGPDGYDYGVFDFADLIAHALHDQPFESLDPARQDRIFAGCKADVSDHMPIWTRLPIPGA